MARPIWSGAIAFGIVSIPVQLFSAVHEHDIHFHQISRQDRRRIHYRKVVEGGDAPIRAEDIVKGIEVRKGRYVVFDDDELAKLAGRKSTTIAIEAFVPLGEIDPRYFESLYYLFPGRQAEKPYQLLHRALAQAGLVGIARLVMHGKEHLIIVRAFPAVLGVQTLRFADEIRDPKSLHPLPHASVTQKELEVAGKLIESMSGSFSPTAFKDEYLGRLRSAIARKTRGQTLEVEEDKPPEAGDGKILDLMAALDRSLKARRGPGRTVRPAVGSRPQVRRAAGAGEGSASGPAATRHGPRRRRQAS